MTKTEIEELVELVIEYADYDLYKEVYVHKDLSSHDYWLEELHDDVEEKLRSCGVEID